ncbi:MAG: hypothetical protein MJA83_07180, partial [Gammaproteobacteria bacterium]|nr:hypothetical protein [Gammaproteobacteria bacterium]
MNPREIPDISEAEELLKVAETEFPSSRSANDFREAFQLLTDFIELEKPEQEIQTFVRNLKYSYARTILAKLNQVHENEFDLFLHYIVVLFVSAKSEFEDIRKSHPDLGRSYDECREKFKLQSLKIS